jgi:hypothetical protein
MRIALALFATLLLIAPTGSVLAAGAVAIGIPANVARDGVAAGVSIDSPSTAAASREALSLCRGSKVGRYTRSLCKVVKTFSRQCAAMATDPQPGTTGFGYGVASTKGRAQSIALAQCKASSGLGRAGACEQASVACDRVGGS